MEALSPTLLLAVLTASTVLHSVAGMTCPADTGAACHQLTGNTPDGCTHINYPAPANVSSQSGRGNPERGFYRYTETHASSWQALNTEELQQFVDDGYTLIFRYVVLDSFVKKKISKTILTKIGQDFDTLKTAGMKVVLRFCYSINIDKIVDAKPKYVKIHLKQLAPILQKHAGVVAVVQAGFIGVWGEWYYTKNYGNEGVISSANWAKREAVVTKLLQSVPASRHIQLRTTNYKQTILDRMSPITQDEAYQDTPVARWGLHNDCFLASDDDYGTYVNRSHDYPYLQQETLYVPMGGETCNHNPPRSDCVTAEQEMRDLHFTYLNDEYEETILNDWKTQGCYDRVWSSLGYRLVGTSARLPMEVPVGGKVNVGVVVRNLGWAAPINYRSVQMILRHVASGEEYQTCGSTGIDLRTWLPGERHSLQFSLTLPNDAPAGQYKVLLKLPDGDTRLEEEAAYNIVMENLVDSEDPDRRLNLLGRVKVVTE